MNRKQRRRWNKKYKKAIPSTVFPPGTKVILNYKRLVLHNPKRNQWCELHKDEVFTIEKVNKFNTAHIYSLEEDETEPKWLFSQNDLLTVEEYLRLANGGGDAYDE